jgi:hypothetical protein
MELAPEKKKYAKPSRAPLNKAQSDLIGKTKFIARRYGNHSDRKYDLRGLTSYCNDDKQGLSQFDEYFVLAFNKTPLTDEQRTDVITFLQGAKAYEENMRHFASMPIPRTELTANGNLRIELPSSAKSADEVFAPDDPENVPVARTAPLLSKPIELVTLPPRITTQNRRLADRPSYFSKSAEQ